MPQSRQTKCVVYSLRVSESMADAIADLVERQRRRRVLRVVTQAAIMRSAIEIGLEVLAREEDLKDVAPQPARGKR